MANYKTVFLGTEESSTDNMELECFVNEDGEIAICIDEKDYYDPVYARTKICLDKSTAIKFAKSLRSSINLIDQL